MRWFTALLAFLALVACQPDFVQETPEDRVGAPNEPSNSGALVPIESLAGEWRVAGIDGEALDERYGLTLSADDNEIWWEPRCAGVIRSYRIDGTALAIGSPRASGSPTPPGVPPPPICTIGWPPRLVDVGVALDAAVTIGRTPSNGIELSGGGHSLTLFSQ
ncbi:hypothetical protein P7228_07670 [Altererythrobacter arenosus]|uniref:Lipocalin-like domain-containing protein n=1 Tax=Altererythrobacter arenosus TaxID=3032592 RepID=A0ABY8FZW1_9SPHN|nr:hypothetical protein [Altererythrobacter sp. CAU 1644]WFL78931.1 hypothetical protein P7228_07670 [Altererythrobacter sp. CAU 1644]